MMVNSNSLLSRTMNNLSDYRKRAIDIEVMKTNRMLNKLDKKSYKVAE